MINSRKIEDLHPTVAERCRQLIIDCDSQGIDIIITSTYRDHVSQKALYNQGRTSPGRIVTNAKPGQSFHNWRVAFDVVPIRNGKAVWGTVGDELDLWFKIGTLGKALGLEWAGEWVKFREYPHFQYTGGLTIADFKAGKELV